MANLSIGLVGLPNVGKSTLFNALTRASVPAENYPFCTIDPNTGVIPLKDSRLDALAKASQSEKTLYATVSFTDIAGLVQGASKGEGLDNTFLSHIRETTAIVHVVRCFDDDDITHVAGSVDPVRDASTIDTELILADLDRATQAYTKHKKTTKAGDAILDTLKQVCDALEQETPIRKLACDLTPVQDYQFLTAKPMIYVANTTSGSDNTAYYQALCAYADCVIPLSAAIEAETAVLEPEEQVAYLAEYGITESGLSVLAKTCFDALGLQVYFTTGPKESRAWIIKHGTLAPQAAGVIHSDFERGFIRATVTSYADWLAAGSLKTAKSQGLIRQEGKTYIMVDGDIVEFLFNV